MQTVKKILLAQTSPTVAAVTDSLLRQRGFDVVCLSNAQAAFEFAKKEQPDLILSGLALEGGTGIELCRRLSSDPLTGGIPVLMLVSDKDGALVEQVDLCGARGRLKMPFSPKELLENVNRFVAVEPQSMRVTRIVDQDDEDSPRLSPAEEGSASAGIALDTPRNLSEIKSTSALSLGWEDVGDESAEMVKGAGKKIDFDDGGLEIEEDQYGLSSLAESGRREHQARQEDYDWFIEEMRREMSGTERQPAVKRKEGAGPTSSQAAEPKVDYHDVGPAMTENVARYRKFLEEFEKDAMHLGACAGRALSEVEVDRLAELVAQKLAKAIVAQLDKDEIKRIIASCISSLK